MGTICLPAEVDQGLDSPLCKHFGSAPLFVMVKADEPSRCSVLNRDAGHMHGQCNPVSQLEGQDVEAVVVGGIGRRALEKLSAAGIRVYRTELLSVGDAVAALLAGELSPLDPANACTEHHHAH
jgi:predicted Fe-Mo cluster-binding NifX family protein